MTTADKPKIWAFDGDYSTMKSSYALTFPGKIACYDWDLGVDRAHQYAELIDSGTLDMRDVSHPMRNMFQRYAKLEGFYEAWEAFIKDYLKILSDPAYSTVILDTSTMLWRLCCDALLQIMQQKDAKRQQLLQMEYGTANQWMMQVMNAAKPYNKHLILVHHLTQEYKPLILDGQPLKDDRGNPKSFATGNSVADGWKYTAARCDWIFRCTKVGLPGQEEGIVTVEKPGNKLAMSGLEIQWWTYDKFLKLQEAF